MKLNQEIVINKMKDLEPNYNFDKFIFSRSTDKSTIICDKGHEYVASYSKFINNRRCPVCAIKKRNDSKRNNKFECIKKMQELEPGYNFSKFEYIDCMKKSIIICDKGHEYLSNYVSFVGNKQARCPICRGGVKYEQSDVISKMKELEPNYDFSKFKYIKAISKSTVICSNGHEYETSWNTFQQGHRCPICSNGNTSNPETEIIEFIKTFYNGTIEQSNRNIIKNYMTNRYLELDIYLPELNKAIEFNGLYFHTDEKIKRRGWNSIDEYHIMKSIYCKAKGIELLHIFEDKWIEDKESELLKIQEFLK